MAWPFVRRAALSLFVAAVLLGAAPAVAAQESEDIDDLFEEPDAGLGDEAGDGEGAGEEERGDDQPGGEEGGESDQPRAREDGEGGPEEAGEEPGAGQPAGEEGVDVEALTMMPLTVGGTVTARAGVNLGFEEWPGSEAAEGREADELLRRSLAYDMASTLSFDARPAPYLRFYTSLEADLDTEAMRFDGPDIDELFVDYTLAGNYFFRAGAQKLTWGQGRILGNPANLVERVSDGIALRGSAPLGRGSITGVVYSTPQWVGDGNGQYRAGSPRAFAYAGLYEATVGAVTAEVSSHYKKAELTQSAASLTIGLGPIDLTTEARADWEPDEIEAGVQETGALAQAFWESDGGSWSILAEYELDSAVSDTAGHYAGAALRGPALFGDWRPRIRARHAFEDHSGEVIPALAGTIAPKLTATVTTPVLYGEPGSFYREEAAREEDDEELGLPFQGEEVLQLLLGVRLSFSF
jgi:hypothetical protein